MKILYSNSIYLALQTLGNRQRNYRHLPTLDESMDGVLLKKEEKKNCILARWRINVQVRADLCNFVAFSLFPNIATFANSLQSYGVSREFCIKRTISNYIAIISKTGDVLLHSEFFKYLLYSTVLSEVSLS